MLIFFFKAAQESLFEVPVAISGSVRKDGTVIKPHFGIRRKKIETHHVQGDIFGHTEDESVKKRRSALDALLAKYGGAAQIAAMLRGVSAEQKTDAIGKMAKIAKVSADEMRVIIDAAKPEDAQQADLFSQDNEPSAELPKEAVEPPKEFTATHMTSDGTPVVATDDDNVWVDADGNEYEDHYAVAIRAEKPGKEEVKAKLREKRDMIADMIETKRQNGETVPDAVLQKLSEVDALIGDDKPQAARDENKEPDFTGWTGPQMTAYFLKKEWDRNRVEFLNDKKALANFKRKLRSEAKNISEDDSRAVMLIDALATKIWGTDYNPRIADIQFKPKAVDQDSPEEGDRNAEGLVFHNGRWHREKSQAAVKPDKLKAADIRAAIDFAQFTVNDLSGHTASEFRSAPVGDRINPQIEKLRGMLASVPERFKADIEKVVSRLQDKLDQWNKATSDDVSGTVGRGEAISILMSNGFSVEEARDKIDSLNPESVKDWQPDAYTTINADTGKVTHTPGSRTVKINSYDAATIAAIRPDEKPKVAHDTSLPFGVPAGTSKAERRRINAAAIDLVNDDKTEYTEADKALLRQYSGNGGCGDSLNEFYTDPEVAAAMWSVAENLGFTSGTALEPSSGTGVFLHTAPAGFKFTGIELDPMSAKIATVLHGDRHEIQNASLERFATQDMRQYDVVIGNPPYGPRGMLAKDDKIELSKAEEYFIDTSLDKTRDNGLCMLVVPAGIMDSKNGRAFRERILRKAQFIGAQRMPNTAFEAAHTDVTADILYFIKRPQDVAGALGVVDQDTLKQLNVWDPEFLSGGYFEGRGAGNVFGSVGTAMRAFGEIYTVNGSMKGVPEEIAKFKPDAVGNAVTVDDVLNVLGDDEAAKNRAISASQRRPYETVAKVGDIRVIDGVSYVLQGNPPRWHRVDQALQSDAVTEAQTLAAEINALMNGSSAVDRPNLEADIRAWVEKHGNPSKNQNILVAAANDKSLYRLIGAVGKDGELSDVVRGVTAQPAGEGGFDTIARSLALSHETNDFTASELAASLGMDREEVLDRLVADDAYAFVTTANGQETQWAPIDVYLTGELWGKLDDIKRLQAREVPAEIKDKLEYQARRLEETIDPQSLEDVEIKLNTAFIPTSIIAAWLNARVAAYKQENKGSSYAQNMPEDASVTFDKGIYKVSGGLWGDADKLYKYLNRTGVRKDDMPAIDQMNDEFKDWLCGSNYRDEIEDLYNRKFRGFVQRDFSNEPINVPGLANYDQIKDYQWPGLRWALTTGKGIIAADVGLGKTLRGLLLARMSKIEGRATKPTIVVPKSVLANWYAESQKWFPGSRVMTIGGSFSLNEDGTITGKDDNANERKRKYHDLSQNDYDFVIISEPAFEELDLDPITKNNYYSDDFWVQRGDSLGNAGDKRVKKIRESYEQAIAKREFSDRTDAIYFNEIGIDMLIADEMHHQKNLYAAKNRFGESPKFLGGQGLSNRALDFNLKTRWLLQNNNNRGIYGLTATPTKNSPLEIYSMLSHIAPEAFENIGVRNSEEFLDRFCVFQNDTILSTSGQVEDALITAGFKNMNELREIMKRYIDRKTADDVGLELPKAEPHMHFVEMSPKQQAVYEELRLMLEENAKEKDATGETHIFSIMDKMNKAALDLEIYDPVAHKGAKSPKYKSLAKHVVEGLADGGQVIFSDYIDSHDKIVDALVASGVKRDEIGIINAQVAGSAVKRQNIADKFNAGKLKVVIGNTATMGEGINLQKGTADIHHLDLPWEPASMQQRNGRGVRQGNTMESVRIHTYLSKGSFDGYRYQSIAAKKDWQDLLWNGGDRVDNLAREGKFSRQEMQIMMAADPEAARAKFENDKALATAQYEAGERVKAAEVFVKFQELKAGYKSLKNKNSMSAQRLKKRIDDARTALRGNKFFTAKSALDSDIDVIVQPETGLPFHAGVAFEAVADDGKNEGKFVVTGVNLKSGTVTVRKYASTETSKTTLGVSKLAHGITPFAFDADAEGKELAQHMAAEDAEKLNNIKKYDDVMKLPSAALEQAYDSIQQQLKEGAKSYKVDFGYGDVPMINKETGNIDLVPRYSTKDKAETHDFFLPTIANKKKLEQAWMDAERSVQFGTDYQTSGRRGSKSTTVAKKKYAGNLTGPSKNPFSTMLAKVNNEADGGYYGATDPKSVKEIKAKFLVEQIARLKGAKTMNEAIDAVMPLGEMSDAHTGYSAKLIFPKRVLAMMWAKARQLGVLDDKMEAHEPKHTIYGDKLYSKHNAYATRTGNSDNPNSVHEALIEMARNSGYKDLQAAMVMSGIKHAKGSPFKTIKLLTGVDNIHALQSALSLVEEQGLGDSTVGAYSGRNTFSGVLNPDPYDYSAQRKTIRQALTDRIAELKQNARSEATGVELDEDWQDTPFKTRVAAKKLIDTGLLEDAPAREAWHNHDALKRVVSNVIKNKKV